MYWHIDTDIISFFVLAAIYVYSVKIVSSSENAQTNSFLWCLRIALAVTAIDIAASVVMEVPTSRFVYHLLMTVYFVSIELSIVSWFCYAITILYHDDQMRRKRAGVIVKGSYLAYAALAATNPWTGIFYTLGENNAYARGPLFFLMVAVYALYTLALFVLVIIRRRHVPKGYSVHILLLMPLVVAASIAAQLLNPGWLMILPGYMLSLVAAFLFLQTRRSHANQTLVNSLSIAAQTDQLTGLFNRVGMEQQTDLLQMDNMGVACLVAVVDIDDLKSINDAMGHTEGDRAIQAVAKQLKSHFRASDIVARFGGDEFVVYLIGNMSELQAHQNMKRLVGELTALRVGPNKDVPVRASVGAVVGAVGNESFELLCNRADAALYHVKQHGKNGYAFYEPTMETTVFDGDVHAHLRLGR